MSEKGLTPEEQAEWERAKEICRKVDELMAPLERAFMVYVKAYRALGYGRMIQMINEKWEVELGERRQAFFCDERNGTKVEDLP